MKFKNLFPKRKSKVSIKNSQQNHPLLTSEDKVYQTLFEDLPDGLLIFNENKQVVGINKQATILFGYSMKELQSDRLSLFPAQSLEVIHYHTHKALQGKMKSFDHQVIHKKGHQLTVNITFLPILINGDVRGFYGIFKDSSEHKKREEELFKLHDHLQEAQRVAQLGNWEYDYETDEAYLSDQVYSIYQIDKQNFTASYENLLSVVHQDDRNKLTRLIDNAIKLGTPYELNYQIQWENGEERIIHHKADVIYNQKGEVSRLVGTVQDVTETLKIREKLKKSELQLRSISNNLSIGIWSYDVKADRLTYCSDGMEDIYGVPKTEFYQDYQIWKAFVHPEDLYTLIKSQRKLEKGLEIRNQYRIVVNGEIKWVDDQTIPVVNEQGKLIRVDGIVTDITEQKCLQEKIEQIANHDSLTNLPNRRYFEQKLTKLIGNANGSDTSFAVLALDLDRFTYINDSLGHIVGDELLKVISTRLNKIINENSFLARSDGDEFLFCINGISGIDEYIDLATKIRKEIENPIFIDDYELFITTSIGMSFYPYDADNVTGLLKNADIALRKAKESGKNNYQIFSPSMDIESFKLYTLERDLRKAIINEEFFIEYQPKVETKTGKIVGAEALIRWEHPEWGRISPAEFIPLAEETGLIFKLDDWVFTRVCQQLMDWKKKVVPVVPVSINFSPNRFLKANVVEEVSKVLEETGVHPGLIEFEITERTLIKHEDKVRAVMSELKEIGVKFSLDDFGTGYSSLSYLKNLSVDQIKIDKSFIDEIGKEKNTEAIIKSVIYLARELDMKVVAEGVETSEQLTFLSQRECQFIQGYAFSKPVSKNQYEKMVKTGFLKAKKSFRSDTISENRRQYYRINFPFPLCSGMTIISFKGKTVNLGHSKALIEDISIGGHRFTTNVELPVQPDIILEFKTKLINEPIKVTGIIVWKQEIGDNLYQYGLEYTIAEVERDHLSKMLNTLLIKLKNDPLCGGCDFHLEGRSLYFN